MAAFYRWQVISLSHKICADLVKDHKTLGALTCVFKSKINFSTHHKRREPSRHRLPTEFDVNCVFAGVIKGVINVHCTIAVIFNIHVNISSKKLITVLNLNNFKKIPNYPVSTDLILHVIAPFPAFSVFTVM